MSDDYKILVQRKDSESDTFTTISASEIRDAETPEEAVARFASAFITRPTAADAARALDDQVR